MEENVHYIQPPKVMTPEQRTYWHSQAAYWAITQENAERAVEYAGRQRESALRMLGLLGVEKGLSEND